MFDGEGWNRIEVMGLTKPILAKAARAFKTTEAKLKHELAHRLCRSIDHPIDPIDYGDADPIQSKREGEHLNIGHEEFGRVVAKYWLTEQDPRWAIWVECFEDFCDGRVVRLWTECPN